MMTQIGETGDKQMTKLILEGSDLIGKSTAYKMLKDHLPVQDRNLEITHSITEKGFDLKKIWNILSNDRDTLYMFMYASDPKWFDKRLPLRDNPDEYDLKCREYNNQYILLLDRIRFIPNVVSLDVIGLDPVAKTARIFEEYLRFVHYRVNREG